MLIIMALTLSREMSIFINMSADLTKGSFGHFGSFYVIKISKTPKISIFCMFLQASQIASDMLYNQRRKQF